MIIYDSNHQRKEEDSIQEIHRHQTNRYCNKFSSASDSDDVQRSDTTTATMSNNVLQWEPLSCSVVDQGPLFLSCATLDTKSRQLVGVASLEKNRFCELVRFDIGTCLWTGCTRTRHFRPPKRIGSASAAARGHILIFGGYELSNQIELNNRSSRPRLASSSSLALPDLNLDDKKLPGLKSIGYPQWWFRHQQYSLRLIGEALGDFHGFDSTRGEWNVVISRDRTPVNAQTSTEPSMWRRQHFWQPTTAQTNSSRSRAPTLLSGNVNGDPLPEGRAFHTLTKCSNALYLFGGEKVLVHEQSDPLSPETNRSIFYFNDLWQCDLRDLRWTLLSTGTQQKSPPTFREQILRQLDARQASSTTASEDPLEQETVLNGKTEMEGTWRHPHGIDLLDTTTFLDTTTSLSGDFYFYPESRSGHTAVSYQRIMYIYGGQNSTTIFNDLWAYDPKRGWNLLHPSGTSPGERFGHTAVVVSHGMCVYGGVSLPDLESSAPTFSDNNSIFFLDFGSSVWSQLPVLGSPPVDARYFGRLHGFYWDNCLWLGGPNGRESFDGFDFFRVNLTDALPGLGPTVYRATTTTSKTSGRHDFRTTKDDGPAKPNLEQSYRFLLTPHSAVAHSLAELFPFSDSQWPPPDEPGMTSAHIPSQPKAPGRTHSQLASLHDGPSATERQGLRHVHRDGCEQRSWEASLAAFQNGCTKPFTSSASSLEPTEKGRPTEESGRETLKNNATRFAGRASERVVLDVACVTRLQLEAAAAREENAVLKEALLLLIECVNTRDLNSMLHAADILRTNGNRSHDHSSMNHRITDLILEATRTVQQPTNFLWGSPHSVQLGEANEPSDYCNGALLCSDQNSI